MSHELESPAPIGPSNETVYRWVQDSAVGNAESQRNLCLWIAPKAYKVVRRIVGLEAADDVSQDVLIKFFTNLDKFRFESKVETWVHQIAVNASLQFLRSKGRESKLQRNYAEHRLAGSSSDMGDSTFDIVDIAMERLTGEQQAILRMKEVDGMDYRSISEALEIPLGTVGSRLNKARTDLRTEMLNLGWRSD